MASDSRNKNPASDDDFVNAVRLGKTEQVKEYVASGFNWNRLLTTSWGRVDHPLNFALGSRQKDVVYLLLELEADPDFHPCNPPSSYSSPLELARICESNPGMKAMRDILESHLKIVSEIDQLPSSGAEIDSKIDELVRKISEAEAVNHRLDEVAEAVKFKRSLMAKVDGRLQEITKEIKTLSDEREAKNVEKSSLEKYIRLQSDRQNELRSKESYMSDSKISYHRKIMQKFLQKKNNSVVEEALCRDLECVVCLVVPTTGNIYSCFVCGNIMCAECAPKMKTCPSCRQNFKRKPYSRNIALEKIARRLSS